MSKVRVNIELVKQLMTEKSIDSKEMAKFIGVSDATLKKYFTNDYNYLSIKVVFKIADVFKIPIVAIIG